MARRLIYFVNPAAAGGRGLARWRRVEPLLRVRGLAGRTVLATSGEDLARMVAAASPRHDVVVAGGGDGTVLNVVTGLRQAAAPGTAMAILPIGSGNDAARMIGVERLDTAVDSLAMGAVRAFDCLEVTCHCESGPTTHTGLVLAGAGLAADFLLQTPPSLKRWLGGSLGYVAGFFLALARYRPYPLEACCGGSVYPGPLAAVVAANHTHAGGHSMHIGPGARPDDGRMDVSVVHGLGRLAVARHFVRLVRGTHVHHPAVAYRREVEVALSSPSPIAVQADGEILGHTPATLRLIPSGVRLLVPPGA